MQSTTNTDHPPRWGRPRNSSFYPNGDVPPPPNQANRAIQSNQARWIPPQPITNTSPPRGALPPDNPGPQATHQAPDDDPATTSNGQLPTWGRTRRPPLRPSLPPLMESTLPSDSPPKFTEHSTNTAKTVNKPAVPTQRQINTDKTTTMANTPPSQGNDGVAPGSQQTSYINSRTQQALTTNTISAKRYQANPYHNGATPPPPIIPPGTSTNQGAPPTLSRLNTDQRPSNARYTWNSALLSTPLIKIPKGTSPRWTQTGESLSVQLEQIPAFDRTKHKHLSPTEQLNTPLDIQEKLESDTQFTGGPGPPTPDMIALGHRIRSIPVNRLLCSDITITRSSIGTSVLVAILIDKIRKIYHHPTAVQLHNFAHVLLTTHPETLLEYYQSSDKLQQFLQDEGGSNIPLPTFSEESLCPCKTPMTVRDANVRSRLKHGDLMRQDYITLIHAFVAVFYPANLARVRKTIRETMRIADITAIATVPGQFPRQFARGRRVCFFDPPRWVDLTLPPVGTPLLHAPADSNDQGSETETEEAVTCLLDGFTPSQQLGLSPEEIGKMHVRDLRSRALTTLPTILKQLTTPIEAADIVLTLAGATDDDFYSALTTSGFQKCLAKIRTPIIACPPHPTTQHRIRLHLAPHHEWTGTGEVLAAWALEIRELMLHLNHSFILLRPPYDTHQADYNILNSIIDVPLFENYATPRRSQGMLKACDIWCATSCDAWGSSQDKFPYSGPQVTNYYTALETNEITCECLESFPFGLTPCVALVGSDRRDDSTRIFQEYMTRLQYRIDDQLGIPPFQIIWRSLWTPTYRSVMIKCVACLPEYALDVTDIFETLQKATLSSSSLVTQIYNIHLLQHDPSSRTQAITDAATAQQCFLDGCTRVIVNGLNLVDPLLFQPRDYTTDGLPCSYSLTEQILHGTVLSATGAELSNPIMKVTMDSGLDKYYLTAHKDDAQLLIKYATALLPTLARWLQRPATEFSLDTSDARKFVHLPKTQHALLTATPQGTNKGSQPDIMSTLLSIQQSLLDHGTEIRAIRAEMRDHVGRTLPSDVVSAVQSSITHATLQWKDQLDTTHNRFTNDIVTLADGLHSVCKELGDAKTQDTRTLTDLVDQYDNATTITNDTILAYGNEIAMMRINVEALSNRLNWIVEDLGLRSHPTEGSARLPPLAMDMVMEAVYDDYYQGKDMANADAAHMNDTAPPKIAHDPAETRHPESTDTDTDHSRDTPTNGTTVNEEMGALTQSNEGRPGTPQPPLSPQAPSQTHSAPPLADSPGHTEIAQAETPATETTTMEPPQRNAVSRGTDTTATEDTIDLSPTSSEPSTTHLPTPIQEQSTDPIIKTGCVDCEAPILTPRKCERCNATLCTKCITIDSRQEPHLCTNCRSQDLLTQPGSMDDQPTTAITNNTTSDTQLDMSTVNNTSSDSDPHSDTSSSDSSMGSSYSQRTTQPPPRHRRTLRSNSTSTLLQSAKPPTTNNIPTIPDSTTTSLTKKSRRSVQPSIDTLLRPHAGRPPAKKAATSRTRGITDHTKHF